MQADVADLISAWESAIDLYRAQEFSLAEEAFRRVLSERPEDGPASVYAARCSDLRVNPPGADWDGVFVMTHK